jgi:hypothetical protein
VLNRYQNLNKTHNIHIYQRTTARNTRVTPEKPLLDLSPNLPYHPPTAGV